MQSGAPRASAAAVSREELLAFARAFVVEQTGYPEELVEPDADLEADLGIDSIRKAQLLGEIAERYEMTHLAGQITDLSLDDFPTLEAITDFFFEAAGRTTEQGSDASNSVVESGSGSAVREAVDSAAVPEPFVRVPEIDRVMQRYVLRAVPDPLSEDTAVSGTPFSGRVVVLGDNADGRVLVDRLQEAGSTVDVIPVSADTESVVAAFDAMWNRQPVDHLVVMTSSGEQPQEWDRLRDEQILAPYFVIQRWIRRRLETFGRGERPAGILAAVTRLGGDFGIGRRIGNVSGGALTGLFKGIAREYEEITAKVLDVTADEPMGRVADVLFQELSGDRPEIEVGSMCGQRHRLQMVPQPASGIEPRPSDAAGPWVVTGGARGITAKIAAALGRTPGVRLHLVGRSPEPDVDPAWRDLDEAGLAELKKTVMRQAAGDGKKPIDAWNAVHSKIRLAQSLQDLRRQGLNITYHACDVSDRESVRAMLDAVRQQDGPITGVIHGAGIEAAARFDRKQPESVRRTVTSKVDGARWLWELTAEDDLRWFVGFGSTSGRFGGIGQTDYSMASDLLCRMAWQFSAERPDCRVFGIHWPPWGEVGMAARPESRFALESAGLKFVGTDEGISHLLDELDIRSDDGEVVVVDRDMAAADAEEQEKDRLRIERAHMSASRVRSLVFVDGIIDGDASSLTTEIVFDPARQPVVSDHRVDGVPVVPGTVLLEACLQAAELLDPARQVAEVRNFTIVNGIACRDEKPQRARVHAVREADGRIECRLVSEFRDQKNRVLDPARPIASVQVIMSDAPVPGAAAESLPTEFEELQQAKSPHDFDPQHVGTVYHGPSMGRLKGAIIQHADQGWFRVADPQGQNTVRGTDRPVILDALLQGNDLVIHRSMGVRHLLRAIDRIVFHQPMEEQFELISYHRLTPEDDDAVVWNVQCFTPDRQALVTLEKVRSFPLRNRENPGPAAPSQSALSGGPTGSSIQRPLLMRAQTERNGLSSVVTIPVDPVQDWFFSQHCFRGIPFLPGVMMIEAMGEAAETLAHPDERAVAMKNMKILRGIRGGTDPVPLTLRCTRNGQEVSVELFESPAAARPSCEAVVVLGTSLLPMADSIPEPHGDFVDFEYRDDTPVWHGPAMRSLQAIAACRFQGTATLQTGATHVMDQFPAGSRPLVDAAILDGAIVACGTDAWAYYGNVSEVPDAFDEILFGPLPDKGESCVVSFNCRTTHKKETTRYDVVLQGANRQTLMQINGFQLRRISGPPTVVDLSDQQKGDSQ